MRSSNNTKPVWHYRERAPRARPTRCRTLAEVRQRRRPDTGVDAVAGCSDERNAPLKTTSATKRAPSFVYLVERRGLRPPTRLRGHPSGQRVLASRSPPGWFQGPRDLLTQVGDPRQDGPARALQRGLGESIPTAVYLFARCARSVRSRLRTRGGARTVAREPRHLASRGSPQSLGARRARIATTDRSRRICPPTCGLLRRSDGGCRKGAERRHVA